MYLDELSDGNRIISRLDWSRALLQLKMAIKRLGWMPEFGWALISGVPASDHSESTLSSTLLFGAFRAVDFRSCPAEFHGRRVPCHRCPRRKRKGNAGDP